MQAVGIPYEGATAAAKVAGWVSAMLTGDVHSQAGQEFYELIVSDPDTASQAFDLLAAAVESGDELWEAVESVLNQIDV